MASNRENEETILRALDEVATCILTEGPTAVAGFDTPRLVLMGQLFEAAALLEPDRSRKRYNRLRLVQDLFETVLEDSADEHAAAASVELTDEQEQVLRSIATYMRAAEAAGAQESEALEIDDAPPVIRDPHSGPRVFAELKVLGLIEVELKEELPDRMAMDITLTEAGLAREAMLRAADADLANAPTGSLAN